MNMSIIDKIITWGPLAIFGAIGNQWKNLPDATLKELNKTCPSLLLILVDVCHVVGCHFGLS